MKAPRYPHLHLLVKPSDLDEAALALWEQGAAGIEERDDRTMTPSRHRERLTLVASFADIESAHEAMGALAEHWDVSLRFVEGDGWRDEWKKYFKTQRMGRLIIRPSWEPEPEDDGSVVMTLDPGRAFGTGTHPTTRLVLAQAETRVKPGCHVLDLGCGSGILSIASLLLGAATARGVDVDADAVRVALANAAANGVADRFDASTTPIDQITEPYPLVFANIESTVLFPQAAAVMRCVAVDGYLVLGGLLRSEAERAVSHYASFVCEAQPHEGDWVSLVLRRERA